MKISRDELISRLYSLRNTDKRRVIKVITGIRGCGKSSLMDLYADFLHRQGVSLSQIISLDFEALRYDPICSEGNLYNYIGGRIYPDRMNYLILQEIRYAENITKIIDSYSIYDNIDIYVTASNTYLTDEELPKMLFGSFIVISVFPLSFAEYCSAAPAAAPEHSRDAERYAGYLKDGAFPYITYKEAGIPAADTLMAPLRQLSEKTLLDNYIRGIYDKILVHEIIPHCQISDTDILEYLLYFISLHIGEILSPKKISDTLRLAGRPVNTRTVDSYLNAFAGTFVIFRAGRFDILKNETLKTLEKYYIADTGLRSHLFGLNNPADSLPLLENMVFIELLRRGYRKVCLGKAGPLELSFVAFESEDYTDSRRVYIQIADTVNDEKKLSDIMKPYKKIRDNYPKYIISFDDEKKDLRGVNHIPALDFLGGAEI